MKILLLSAHLPSPQARQAGQKTSYHICEFLARRHEVHLLSFVTDDEAKSLRTEDMKIFGYWDVVSVTNWTRLCGVLAAPHLPFSIAARFANSFRQRLVRILKDCSYDVAILDHMAMWQHQDLLESVPLIGGSAHDVLSQLWDRRAANSRHPAWRWISKREGKRVENWERSALKHLHFVSAHSEKDSQLLSKLDPTVLRCPIQPWYTSAPEVDCKTPRKPHSVVFWGAMNRSENVDAVRFALKDIIPVIRAQVPEARFIVAGSHSDSLPELRAPETSDIVATGYVEDIHKFLSGMQVALLPLRLGAGIKVKTLECMAAGVAVVTTPIGIEGISGMPGKHYLLGESPDDLARCVVRLLNSPAEREAIGANARELVKAEHQFAASMERLDALLEERCEQSRPLQPEEVAAR